MVNQGYCTPEEWCGSEFCRCFPALNGFYEDQEELHSRSNPPRIEPGTHADNKDATTVTQSNAKTVDRQNRPNDTRGVQLGIRGTAIET